MTEEVKFYLEVAKEQMEESIKHLEVVLAKIRAGKANPQMLRSVQVDYYGTSSPINQMANVNTPDSQTISIQPWDKSVLQDIEKAQARLEVRRAQQASDFARLKKLADDSTFSLQQITEAAQKALGGEKEIKVFTTGDKKS